MTKLLMDLNSVKISKIYQQNYTGHSHRQFQPNLTHPMQLVLQKKEKKNKLKTRYFLPNTVKILPALIFNACDPLHVNIGKIWQKITKLFSSKETNPSQMARKLTDVIMHHYSVKILSAQLLLKWSVISFIIGFLSSACQ